MHHKILPWIVEKDVYQTYEKLVHMNSAKFCNDNVEFLFDAEILGIDLGPVKGEVNEMC